VGTVGIAGCSSTTETEFDPASIEVSLVEIEAEPEFSEFLGESYVDDGTEKLLQGTFTSEPPESLFIQQPKAQNTQYEFSDNPDSALYEDGWYPIADSFSSNAEGSVRGTFYDIDFGTEIIHRSYEYVTGGYSLKGFSRTDRVRVVSYSQISNSVTIQVEENSIEELIE
jgi:hypothetical protein